MEEILKALSPWPVLQGVLLGLLVAAGGVWAMRRGWLDSKKADSAAPVPVPTVEDLKLRWEMQKAIGHIAANSFEIVKLLERQNELTEALTAAVNRVFDTRWNTRQ